MTLSLQAKLKLVSKHIGKLFHNWVHQARLVLQADVYFGTHIHRVPDGAIVFFPCWETMLCCGIAGIVAFKNKPPMRRHFDLEALENRVRQIEAGGFQSCQRTDAWNDAYLGGGETIDKLWRDVQILKTDTQFFSIFSDEKVQKYLEQLTNRLGTIIKAETDLLAEQMGHLSAERVDRISHRLEKVKDLNWRLDTDILSNTKKIRDQQH
jgi:glucosamine--fructose-6-phosphate aminotransferase (isomerizing)